MTDINTVTTPSGCLLLIDSRVADYQDIINAIQPGVQHLVFNVEDTNSASNPFEYIQTRIAELGVSAYTCVGLVQHNMRMPRYSMFGQGAYDVTTQIPAAPDAIIAGVETDDPTLQTWSGVSGFISGLKTTYGIQNFDMMACALYSDPNWKYIIDTLTAQTGVTIRASTDDTGAAGLGGDWFLESHTGVNLKGVYFTEAIENYRGVLYVGSNYWGLHGARRRPIKSFAVGGLQLWGSAQTGGTNNTGVSLANTVGIISNEQSFAALKTDGSVVVWGNQYHAASYAALADHVSVPSDDSLTNSVIDVVGNTGAFAALKSNGSVVIWGRTSGGGSNNTGVTLSNVIEIYESSNRSTFFALKGDGSVVAWGDSYALLSEVLTSISTTFTAGSGIVLLYTTGYGTVAALRTNGSVVACGISSYGGNVTTNTNGSVSSNVRTVYALDSAFVALKSNGSVVQWGDINGQSTLLPPADASNGVIHVFPSRNAAHALKADGSVVGWGDSNYGVANITSTVILICSNINSSAALKSDGSVIAWGNSQFGGSTSTPPGSMALLSSGVIALYSNYYSYAALKSDGSVVCWGNSSNGGNTSSPSNVASSLMSGVVRISPTHNSFSALKSDGSVIRWGYSGDTELQGASIDSGIVDIFNGVYAQVGIKPTSTPSYDLSMSYYTELDRLNILCSRDYRRTVNLTANSNRFTLSSTRSLQKFNYTMPTNKHLTFIVPDYQTAPYSLTSTITLPTIINGSNSVIITSEIGERVNISGIGTYVNYGTYVYKVEANGTYTRTTSLTINSVSYDLYGGDGVYLSGIALYNPISITPTLTNFNISSKTYGIDTSFNLVDPSSNNTRGVFTYTSNNNQVATITGRTVTIIGPGTSVITASQSGGEDYIPYTITASLNVIFGNLNSINRTIDAFVLPRPISNVVTTYETTWYKYGSGSVIELLVGPSQNSNFGNSVSLSADGMFLAVGASMDNSLGQNKTGIVRIFKYIVGNGWFQHGGDILAEAYNDYNGSSVSISANGSIVAVGAIFNQGFDGSGNLLSSSGHTRVYKYNSSKTTAQLTDQTLSTYGPIGWDRLGQDIDAEADGDYSGTSISLSADGTIVAIGATYNRGFDGSGNLLSSSGHTRVYKYNSSKTTAQLTDQTLSTYGPIGWDRLGQDIDGEAAYDYSGLSVSISADGTIVAIYAENNDGSGNSLLNCGHVRVYKYNSSKTTAQLTDQTLSTYGPIGWDRLGQDIDGLYSTESGYQNRDAGNVYLSSDGNVVAFGSIAGSGSVRMFAWNGSNWIQRGQTIFGSNNGDRFYTVSLSSDGYIVAIGAQGYSTYTGYVKMYRYNSDNDTWVQLGSTITGDKQYNYTGSSLSLSADGTNVAIGVTGYDRPIESQSYNDGAVYFYTIGSSNKYTYTSNNTSVAEIYGNIVLPKTTSSTTITVTQSASGANTSKIATFPLLIKLSTTFQTYTIASKTLGDASFNLTDPSSNSTGAFTFTSTNASIATISGRTVTIVGAGTTSITVTQDASGDYAAKSTTVSFTVNPLTTVLGTFTVPAKTYGDASFNLVDPPSNSTAAFTYTSGNTQVATISGRVVTIVGLGTSVITASQASGNYTAASTTASLVVSFGNLTSLSSKVITDGPFVIPTPLSNVVTTYGTTWNQLGADIIGKVAGDESGTSLSVSADGTIVAISARSNTSNRGTVQVYKYNDISWNQLGSDINGEASSDYSGQSVSLSANGRVVAIGANMNDGSGNLLADSGQVRIYEFNGSSWVQRGGDIDGEANADQSGISVSLSMDGNVVAIGAIMNDGSGNALSNSGHVRVYKYNDSKTSPQLTNQNLSTFGPAGWDRLGADIDGEAVNDQSGFSVSLSVDGTIVAIGAIFNDGTSGTVDTSNDRGHVRVYKYNSSKTEPQLTNQGLTTFGPAGWDRMGSDIDGEVAADQTGFSVSLSTDGSTVAIGSPFYDASGVSNSGRVRVFAWNGTSWGQRGGNINGVYLNENVGDSVSLSADGSILSVSSFMKVLSYNYNISTNTWSQIGANVAGSSSGSYNIINALAYSPHVYLDAADPSSSSFSWTNLGSLGGNVVMTNMGPIDRVDNGGSFNFNGTSNYGQLNIVSSTLTSLTYVAVVKTDSNSGARSIIDFGNDNLLLYTSNGPLVFYNPGIDSGFTLTIGVWYVIAVTITTGGAIRFYVNGVSICSGTVATINRTSSVWGIGSGITGPNELWSGKISALAIYHNKVLTATEIANLNSTYQTYKVTLSSQGNIVAIGMREYDGVTGSSTNIGATRIYKIDSSGNYTYTIGNSAIADICGNIVLPKTGGSTTLSITQSASGANTSKTATAQLTLSYMPTFQTYTITSKNFGDASFNLTDPSSDGPGSFTFTSSNTSVATVSGRTVTIVGTGTTTITATQAASGDYVTRSVTASFTVNLITTVLGTFTVPAKGYGDASFNLIDPPSNSTAAFTYTSGNTQVATISGRVVTIVDLGTSVITASQAAGNYTAASTSASLVVGFGNSSAITASITGGGIAIPTPLTNVLTTYGTTWVQRGSNISGEAAGDNSGRSVSMSADGTVVAIGAPNNTGNGTNAGQVRIYAWNNTAWVQRGADIDGEAANDYSGDLNSVSLSADGNVVAIGGYQNNGTASKAGHVRVYAWNNSAWVKRGADIDGEAADDYSGQGLSLSADGNIVAIGGYQNDGSVLNAGHVRVYKYNSSKSAAQMNQSLANFGPVGWDRLGADIDGVNENDGSGMSVSISTDGTIVAIGANSNGGYVRVYKYNASKLMAQTNQSLANFGPVGWDRLGADINGEALADQSGDSVSLSADGTVVAIGAPYNDGTAPDAGHVRVYKYNASKSVAQMDQSLANFGPVGWDRLGADIDGEAAYDNSGMVSLSADGTIVAIGANANDGNGNLSGHVRVYKYNASKSVAQTNQSLANFGPAGWDRLGVDINGLTALNFSGCSVSLSTDGTVVAIGAYYNSSSGTYAGHVRVYKIDSYGNYTYTSNNTAIADICGNIVLPKSAGSTTITLTQSASGANPSKSATIPLTLLYSPTFQTWTIAYKTYGADTLFNLTDPSSNSPGTFTFTSSNTSVATISGRTVTIVGAGTTTITATQAASGNYLTGSVSALFTVTVIGAFTIPTKTYGTDTLFNLVDPSSASPGTFTFTSGNTQVATISGRAVTIVGPGTATITATQAASGNYLTESVTASLVVGFGNLSSISEITGRLFVIPTPLSNVATTYADYWNPLGGNINGEAAGDTAGTSVSISADGTVVAIGANYNDGSISNAGHVRIYKYNPNKTVEVTNQTDASFGPIGWDRLGADIDGEALNDYSGFSVSLSANGRIVAIGAYGNEAAGTSGDENRGHVRVYRYNANKTVAVTNQTDASFGPIGWDRLGADIDGLASPDKLGSSVCISADGTVVACGAPGNNNVYNSSGTVRIFKYNASKTTAVTDYTLANYGPAGWDQLGGNINGEAAGDQSGQFQTVSVSADGTVAAIGSQYNSGNGLYPGHVRVYKYNANKSVDVSDQTLTTFGPKGWDRLGDDIDGEAANIQSGFSVSVSADGTTVAIGAPSARAPDSYQYGHVRVYKYNANKTSAVTDQSLTTFGPKGWDRLGADIDGENQNDYSGSSVSLSADGTIVAIGANGSDQLEGNGGQVRVYKYNPNKTVEQTGQQYVTFGPKGWDRIGRADIDGYGSSGSSVSISSDGTIVAIGAPYADNDGSTGTSADNRGSTRIYKIDSFGNYTYTSSNTAIAEIYGNIVLPNSVGSTTITITQSASGANTSKSATIPLIFINTPTFQTYTIASKTFYDASFNLTDPSSNSAGTFTFTSSNAAVATISGRTVTIVGAGTTTITATQAASGEYSTRSVTVSLVVSPKAPTIGTLTVPAKNFGDASFNLTAPTTDSSGAFIYTSSDPTVATVTSSGGTVTILKVGNTTITATQDACGNFITGNVSASLVVSASLSNFTVPAKNYTAAAFDLTDPTSTDTTVGFTFASSNTAVATIGGAGGRTVSIVGVGSSVITATQAATVNRGELNITATLVVSPVRPVITLANITKAYGNSSFRLTPSSTNTDTSGGSVFSFSSNNIAVVSFLDASLVRINGVGTATIAITQAASANFTDSSGSVVITVNKGASGFSASAFAVAANKTYGDASFEITTVPTSYSTGAITYSSSDTSVATIDNSGVITLVGFGTVNFTATQAESALYNIDTKVSNNLSVARKTVALTRDTPSGSTITKYYGDADFTVSATNESNGAFSFLSSDLSFATVDASSGLVHIVAVGTTTITASRAQTAQYTSTTVSWTLQIERGTTTLSGLSSMTRNVTVAPFTVSASSASNGAVTYALQDPTSTVLTIHPTSGLVTLLSPGSAVIVASQAQGTLYLAPSNITATITVTAAANTLQGATLTSSTSFANVNLNGASLANTNITNTNFSSASLENTNFNSSDISGANMTSSGLSGASLTSTNITNTNFRSARLGNANFNNSTISGSDMTSADLSGATMTGATITGTNFTSAILQRVDLSGASARRCIFNNADLSGCNLRRIDASGSSFVNSNLRGANLSNANFTNSDQTNANINGANISNVSYSVPQKLQLLRHLENRAISELQVSQATGSNVLSVVSNNSSLKDVPNIANATFKVTTPVTTNVSGMNIIDIVLDTSNNTYFYFPINDTEYFRIKGIIYRIDTTTSPPTVRNYQTNAVVENSTYDTKAIRLIAGSLTIIVNSQNTLPASPFVVPSTKINTDAPFGVITAPTSNSSAPIVYSSNNTSIATIHPSTGIITLVGESGFVRFTASQVVTETHESASITSNEMFVNRLIDLSLPGLNQTFSLSTLASLDASSIAVETTDATAVYYVRVSDMTELFQYQTDSFDINDISSSDIKYYVFNRKWPTELKINPSHAMMNKTESVSMLGGGDGYTADKSLVKHDFVRYIALRLFYTIHGVDLFRNETDLLENISYLGDTVQNNINEILSGISTTSSSETMSYDASGNKYLTNDTSGNTNLCRELMRQIAASDPSRLYNNGANNAGLKNVPLRENDSILFKLTITSATGQNALTGVSVLPSRTYTIKLVLKNTVNSVTNANTVVTDSDMYSNSYAYSTSAVTYPPTSDSSGVYNAYSSPAPIPFSRFGYNGWYYTNSTAWVNVEQSVRNRVKWVVPANTAGSSTVGELRYIRINMKVFNKTSLPYLVVYTQAGSYRKYTFATPNSLVNGTVYSFYMNLNSYSREPATIGSTNAALTYSSVGSGSFANNEVVTSIAVESDSGAATGSVEFTLASVVVGEFVSTTSLATEKEYGFRADVPLSYP